MSQTGLLDALMLHQSEPGNAFQVILGSAKIGSESLQLWGVGLGFLEHIALILPSAQSGLQAYGLENP